MTRGGSGSGGGGARVGNEINKQLRTRARSAAMECAWERVLVATVGPTSRQFVLALLFSLLLTFPTLFPHPLSPLPAHGYFLLDRKQSCTKKEKRILRQQQGKKEIEKPANGVSV